MRNFLFFTILALVAFFQTSLAQKMGVFSVLPNLPLVSLFLLIFFLEDYKKVVFSALFLGLLFDFFSGLPFGVFTLTFVLLALVVDMMLNVFISRENIFIFFTIVGLGTLAYYFLNIIFINTFNFFGVGGLNIVLTPVFFKDIFLEVLYNLILAFLVFPLGKFIK